jgi:DNA replicative helicase MCM subunit Mcm2 (Cdc46/Mcm family)
VSFIARTVFYQGDRVRLVGIYRALPSKSNGGTSGVFKTVLLANNVQSLEKDHAMPTLTEVDIANIHKIAKRKKTEKSMGAFDLLARSLAQSIYGAEEIKKGLLCLLLGGEERNLKRGGHIRGDINVCLKAPPHTHTALPAHPPFAIPILISYSTHTYHLTVTPPLHAHTPSSCPSPTHHPLMPALTPI